MFTNDQPSSYSGPSIMQMITVALFLVFWGAFLFLLTYLAAYVVAIVGILSYWLVKRIYYQFNLALLDAKRVPAYKARVSLTASAS